MHIIICCYKERNEISRNTLRWHELLTKHEMPVWDDSVVCWEERTKPPWKELWQQRSTDAAAEDDIRNYGETWYTKSLLLKKEHTGDRKKWRSQHRAHWSGIPHRAANDIRPLALCIRHTTEIRKSRASYCQGSSTATSSLRFLWVCSPRSLGESSLSIRGILSVLTVLTPPITYAGPAGGFAAIVITRILEGIGEVRCFLYLHIMSLDYATIERWELLLISMFSCILKD